MRVVGHRGGHAQPRFRTWPVAAGIQILAAGMDGRYGERRPFARPARQTGWAGTMAAILNAFATRGVVGKTARWAAHLYHRWQRLAPEDPVVMDSVFAALIATRYDFDTPACPYDRSQRIRTALGILHDAGEIRSICHAVVLIVAAEMDFVAHDRAVNTVYVEVVGAELTSMGVPAEHAFGKDPNTCPERLCTIYLPSIYMLGQLLCA
ncbi:MAG: hypothetical protein OXE40_15770 [Gammaproteobacteria bacterium]|nr:hypothetical protein [Gammaproteobacteria bacterium]